MADELDNRNGDSFYTPTVIAEKVADAARKKAVSCIADFAAGDGELLRVAQDRFPGSVVIASDIDRNAVRRLKRSFPQWRVGKCNFLDIKSRARCLAFQGAESKIDLILLNPPFSGRGGSKWHVRHGESLISCSQAMAFVLTALPLLKKDGEIVSIMPAGSLKSHKDQRAWSVLQETFRTDVIGANGHRSFDGCFPRTVIVRITERNKCARTSAISSSVLSDGGGIKVSIHRGSIPMHALIESGGKRTIPLVHTTELRDHKVLSSRKAVVADSSIVDGPAIFLPRVCEPSIGKICLYLGKQKVALSACVIALRCRSQKSAQKTLRVLRRHWDLLEAQYGGTCARYITVDSLRDLLVHLGFDVQGGSNGTQRSLG